MQILRQTDSTDGAHNIHLEEINDKQKLLLTQLSYLNLTQEGTEKIKDGLSIKDLREYLDSPDSFVYGNPIVGENATEKIGKVLVGEAYQTDLELLDEMIANGLGNVKITGWVNNEFTGLQAASFEDSYGNVGISYRGSDFDRGMIGDWVVSDFGEFITDCQNQLNGAQAFFDNVKSNDGNTFIYGHSLGGNIVSYMLLNNPDEVKYAFSFNGNPINQELLDSQEKIDIFNSGKMDFVVVSGDLVGHFKAHDLYSDHVRYIQNSGVGRENPVQAHLPQAAALDNNGNFIYVTKEQMLEYMNPQAQSAASWMHDTKSVINGLQNGEISIVDLCKDAIQGNLDYERGKTENVIDMDDLFKSDSSQHQAIDLKVLSKTAGELFVAGVSGTIDDISESVQSGKDAIAEKASGLIDWVEDIVNRDR